MGNRYEMLGHLEHDCGQVIESLDRSAQPLSAESAGRRAEHALDGRRTIEFCHEHIPQPPVGTAPSAPRSPRAAQASSAVEVAQDLIGLHGTDPASVFLAAGARITTGEPSVTERALYDERSLVRMLGMRRTMFVVPVDLAPVVQAACTTKIAVQERRRLVQHLDQAGVAPDPGTWLKDVEESPLRALEARGEATAAELSDDEPRLRTSLLMAVGKPYQARPNICTRVLFLLAADGRIVRGRPRGSWTSSQYRWSPLQAWLPGGMANPPIDVAQPGVGPPVARRLRARHGRRPAGVVRMDGR